MFNKYTKSVAFIFLFIFSITGTACRREVYHDHFDEGGDLGVISERSFPINPGKALLVDGDVGNIIVSTWDKNEVHIIISGNDRARKKLHIEYDNDNDIVKVRAKASSWLFNWNNGMDVRIEVKIPNKFNPELYTSGGDIKLTGVDGVIKAKTSGGDLFVRNTIGEMEISTSGGSITLEDNKGELNASTSGGDIDGTNFEGSLEVSTSGGNINLDGKNSYIDASTSGGNIDVRYQGENHGIKLGTSGGNIHVSLPADFNAYARMSSSGGNVHCQFSANNAVKISDDKFEGDLNKGGKPLYLKTSGGEIRVTKL